MFIPSMLLRRLYTNGSLKNTETGVQFSVKNRLTDAQVTMLRSVRIDGREVPREKLRVRLHDGILPVDRISDMSPLLFPLRETLHIIAEGELLRSGKHEVEIAIASQPFGELRFRVEDAVSDAPPEEGRIPRNEEDDLADEAIARRRAYVEETTGAKLHHLSRFSFDPHQVSCNCEHFTGVAQVPVGFAGPLHIDGEHAQGEFLIPLATTEGTLVASYNRGMQVINLSGGVKCTVVADAMQRAPAFVFEDARRARDFVEWIDASMDQIRAAAEATSSVAKLLTIDPYLANKFAFLRFDYSTGDAAGQNMVSKATFAACSWILDHFSGVQRFYLEANMATDKKASQINTLRTRGKRVTAEAVLKREVLMQRLRVEPESLVSHYQVANVGAMLAGANNNGLHAANAIAAMFIATGQDVANVAESSTGLLYTELTPAGDLYLSITLPSLIVATHGGGTGLATQRECLELLGCFGKGKVNKLAEIVAGVVLAGEISLAAAISSLEWVAAHESYGRRR